MPEDSIYHKNGEIRETRPIENGMANGVVKRYSEEGKQVQENTFINHLIKNCSPNEFVDERDGNIYKAVKIGNQIWMAENLRYKPEINADCSTPLYFDYETMAEHVYRPMPYEIDNITKIWRHHKKLIIYGRNLVVCTVGLMTSRNLPQKVGGFRQTKISCN